MKFLHTGDLHLGKTLHETSLLEDQRIMLDRLLSELGKGGYAALVIAGDVYDRTIPSTEAVELFSSFLANLRKSFPDLTVLVIPGNHDSARRLSFADRILRERGIHFVCNPIESFSPIICTKDGETLAFFLLPFLGVGTLTRGTKTETPSTARPGELDFAVSSGINDGDSAQERLLETQAELAAEAARRLNLALDSPECSGIPAVLAAHLFTTGGSESGSERVFLGTAEKVSPALFSRFSYVALGHLHKTQRVTDKIWYAGAPLAYAFDEAGAEKCFLSVEIDCRAPEFPVTVTRLPISPLRRMSRLKAAFDDLRSGTMHDALSSDYLEITLTDNELITNPMNLLRAKFPYLLSLRQGEAAAITESEAAALRAQSPKESADGTRDPLADYRQFQRLINGADDGAKESLFARLLSECSDEA